MRALSISKLRAAATLGAGGLFSPDWAHASAGLGTSPATALLPDGAAWLLAGMAVLVLFYCLMRAPWKEISGTSASHAWLVAAIVLALAWQLRVPLPGGAAIHFLGVTLIALMFGPHLGTLTLGLAAVFSLYLGAGSLERFGLTVLLGAAGPCWAMHSLLRATQRYLPQHLFVYLLVIGLFGSALVLGLTAALQLGVYAALQGGHNGEVLMQQALPYALLLAWGEALTVGMLVTLFVIYKPQWMLSFDDRIYLQRAVARGDETR
ncbi:energy-coupling factor ABC transporter permease [Piscinibacterium candidicorallinum]|uniref:Energy-coupling factor ABC transporter permease n=1 Tax=Piscinibacterium candidicorallinum TaxID=1793872 RepID=A0ABV7H4E3_9BURK